MASKGVIVVVSGQDNTGEVFAAVKKHLDETRVKAKETSESLGEIGEALKSGLEMAGIAVGAREIVSQFKEMVTSSMEMAVQIGHLSQQTGMSVQSLSVLRYAAQTTGVDFDVLTRGFKKLSVSTIDADSGNKQAAQGFARLGISVHDLRAKGDDMYAVLTMLADKFSTLPDGMAKSDAAAKIFGARMGSEMIPVLNELGGHLEEIRSEAQSLGLVLDESGIQKMEELHKSVTAMKGAWAGLSLEITSSVAPALEGLAKEMSGLIQLTRLSPGQTIKGVVGGMLMQTPLSSIGQKMLMDSSIQMADMQKKDQAISPSKEKPKRNDIPAFVSPDQGKLEAARRLQAEANRKLADEEAMIAAARQRQENATALAALEGAHKLQLISDAQYYDQKRALTEQAYAIERETLKQQMGDLQKQREVLQRQPTKTQADKVEKDARLTQVRTAELQLEEKTLDVQTKQKEAELKIQNEIDESVKARAKSILQMEAELEAASKGTGAGSALALQRSNAADQRKDLQNGGATPQQLAEFDALQKIKEQQIQVAALDRQREAIALDAGLSMARIDQDELSRSISKEEAQKQRIQAQSQELSKLRDLAEAYTQYGEAGKKAAEGIQQEMTSTMRSIQSETDYTVQDTAEKFAHGIFDPLFQMSGDWKRTWQSMSQNMLRDTGSMLEKQMFKTMFGAIDPRMGAANKNASNKSDSAMTVNGSAGAVATDAASQLPRGNSERPVTATPGATARNGISTEAHKVLGSIMGLFGKKNKSDNATTSNGGLGAGAGATPTAAASQMQVEKSGNNSSGGVQITLINQGQPLQASQISTQSDDQEQKIVQVVLKQFETGGPIAQRIQGMFSNG